MKKDFTKGYKHEIFIGLRDQDSYEEIISVEDFKNIISEVCTKENICFTLVNQFGGYSHNKGYTTETSLRISIIGASDGDIESLGEKLKKKINTDTILISKTRLDYVFM